MKKPIKFLILTTILLLSTYLITGFKESFNGFNIDSVADSKYSNKDKTSFLFFFDEKNGQSISNHSLVIFNYTIENGKIELFNSMKDSEDPIETLYVVRSGLYSSTNNYYYYIYS